jgi:hypothetical protein
MFLISYLYVSVHYRKNSGVSSKLAPVSIVITLLLIEMVMTNCLPVAVNLLAPEFGI